MRLLRFTGFTLLEYLRSGRIVIEIVALLAVFFIFLRRPMNAQYFFSVLGVFTPALTLYTMAAFIGLGDRPQGYVLLARGVGRGTFLLGLFFGACTIVAGAYGLLSLATAGLNRPVDLGFGDWLLGTLPLLLNISLLAALLLMLSPLVFPTGWRLVVLGLIALAFSSNFIGGTLLVALPDAVRSVLRALQALLGGPLVPAFYGFQLAVTRDYSTPTAIANILAQASLLVSLLGLSIYAFARRDLIFSNQ
ncbi:MAG: hypothetical protein HXY37_16950 [Chloroflexi bacterium]|nr:hypothetical protein [Chloroflexota bacterium]